MPILNQFGNVITRRDKRAMGLYATPYSFRNFGNFHIRPWSLQDTETSVNLHDRRTMVSLSRQLFAQMPPLASCSELKACLAVGNGYDPIYHGSDVWGRQAIAWLQNWFPRCCTGGIAFGFRKCLKLLSLKLDEDGDILMMFVQARSGAPLLQFVPTHRIDQRTTGDRIVQDGKYKNYKVANGVVKSANGFPVGYYVQNTSEEDDYIVSARDAFLVYSPRHFDFLRGVPVIASGITTGLSLLDIAEDLQTTIKLESMVNLVETNEQGEAPIHRTLNTTDLEEDPIEPVPNKVVPPPQIQPISGGIRYLKAGSGKLESFQSNRPATETTNYLTDLETKLVSLTGIPHQVLFSPETIGGKAALGISEIVRETVRERQEILDSYARLAIAKALATAIDNGELPPTDEPYWSLFTFTHPEEFSLDRGYDSQIELNELKAGVTTLDDLAQKRGKRGSDIRQKRKQEVIELYQSIAEIKQQFPQYTENQIHNDLALLSANPLPDNGGTTKEGK